MDHKISRMMMRRKINCGVVVVVVVVCTKMFESDRGSEDGRWTMEGEGIWRNERERCESVWFMLVW